jgi:hypothetical protein
MWAKASSSHPPFRECLRFHFEQGGSLFRGEELVRVDRTRMGVARVHCRVSCLDTKSSSLNTASASASPSSLRPDPSRFCTALRKCAWCFRVSATAALICSSVIGGENRSSYQVMRSVKFLKEEFWLVVTNTRSEDETEVRAEGVFGRDACAGNQASDPAKVLSRGQDPHRSGRVAWRGLSCRAVSARGDRAGALIHLVEGVSRSRQEAAVGRHRA